MFGDDGEEERERPGSWFHEQRRRPAVETARRESSSATQCGGIGKEEEDEDEEEEEEGEGEREREEERKGREGKG